MARFVPKKIHAFNDLPTVFVLAFSIQGCVSPPVIYKLNNQPHQLYRYLHHKP